MIKGKTIFIAQNWDDSGVRAQAKALALYLSLNNKVFFLNAHKKGNTKTVINSNLTLLEWPNKRPTGVKDFLFAFKLMRRQKPDIIITNFAANNIMLFASWLLKVKVRICHFHTMVEQYIADKQKLGIKERLNIFAKGIAFRMATHMLPCSSASKKDLLKYFGVNEKKAFVFFNAIAEQEEKNFSNSQVIGFIGRLDRSKGVDVLVKAFAKIVDRAPGATLVLAGKGKEEGQLRQMVEMLQLQDKVTFAGVIGYKGVFNFLRSLNCLVVPSRTDNLPTVVLEGFSCGTMVIASNAGGIPDMVTSRYNGLLFETEDSEELAEKLLVSLQDVAARKIMVQRAGEEFKQKFWLENYPQRFEQFIETHAVL